MRRHARSCQARRPAGRGSVTSEDRGRQQGGIVKILLSVAMLALPCAVWANDPAWLSLGANGQVLARTAVKDSCPQIAVDGRQVAMTPRLARGSQTPPADQRLVCESDVS